MYNAAIKEDDNEYMLTEDERKYLLSLKGGERKVRAMELRGQGKTYLEIANDIGCNTSLPRDILYSTMRQIKNYRTGWTLNSRTVHVFKQVGILSHNEDFPNAEDFKRFIVSEIKKGVLTHMKYRNKYVNQWGVKSFNDLCDWAGCPENKIVG